MADAAEVKFFKWKSISLTQGSNKAPGAEVVVMVVVVLSSLVAVAGLAFCHGKKYFCWDSGKNWWTPAKSYTGCFILVTVPQDPSLVEY